MSKMLRFNISERVSNELEDFLVQVLRDSWIDCKVLLS
jgi:hypothetical protein